jgi:hypothetical protein
MAQNVTTANEVVLQQYYDGTTDVLATLQFGDPNVYNTGFVVQAIGGNPAQPTEIYSLSFNAFSASTPQGGVPFWNLYVLDWSNPQKNAGLDFSIPISVNSPIAYAGQGPTDVTTFYNGWTNYGANYAPASYDIDAVGYVHLSGLIKGGTVGQCAFYVPPGLRPANELVFCTATNGGSARVDVHTDGSVYVVTGNNAWVSLDGISYKAYQ